MSNPIRRGEVSSQVSSWHPSSVSFTPTSAMSIANPFGLRLRHTLRNGSSNPVIPSGINWVWVLCIGGGASGYTVGNYTGGGGGGVSIGWAPANARWSVGLGGTPPTREGGTTYYGNIIAGGGGSSMGNGGYGPTASSGDNSPGNDIFLTSRPNSITNWNKNRADSGGAISSSGYVNSDLFGMQGYNLDTISNAYVGYGGPNLDSSNTLSNTSGLTLYGIKGGSGFFTAGGAGAVSGGGALSTSKVGGSGGDTAFYSGGLGFTGNVSVAAGGGGAGFFGPGQNATSNKGGDGGDGGGGGGVSHITTGNGGNGGILIYY